MKTEIEIREFLKEKTFNQEDTRTIRAIIKAKNYNGINVVNGGVPNSKLIDFINWFEGEGTNDNQDIITIEGNKYEFIEGSYGSSCQYCDIKDVNSPCINLCTKEYRTDKREGYFRLKEQELELIPNEFYFSQNGKYKFIIQFKKLVKEEINPCYYSYMLKLHENRLNINFSCENSNWRIATPEEKQKLINAVEKQENKLWNEQTKTFENKPKDILVPESITIFLIDFEEDILGFPFNKDKQFIYYEPRYKIYEVLPSYNCAKIQCKLIPTLFSEIKAGDIYIECGLNQLNPSCYHIKLHGKEYAKIDGKKDIQVCLDLPDKNQNVYKVVPVI